MTLLLGSPAVSIPVSLYATMTYAFSRGLSPVGGVCKTGNVR